VISVTAVQQNGSRADFPTARTYNAVAAPGVGITSARNTGGTIAIDGTSPCRRAGRRGHPAPSGR
jgi:hypothetical protein